MKERFLSKLSSVMVLAVIFLFPVFFLSERIVPETTWRDGEIITFGVNYAAGKISLMESPEEYTAYDDGVALHLVGNGEQITFSNSDGCLISWEGENQQSKIRLTKVAIFTGVMSILVAIGIVLITDEVKKAKAKK